MPSFNFQHWKLIYGIKPDEVMMIMIHRISPHHWLWSWFCHFFRCFKTSFSFCRLQRLSDYIRRLEKYQTITTGPTFGRTISPLLTLKTFVNFAVIVSPHRSLNTCKRVCILLLYAIPQNVKYWDVWMAPPIPVFLPAQIVKDNILSIKKKLSWMDKKKKSENLSYEKHLISWCPSSSCKI